MKARFLEVAEGRTRSSRSAAASGCGSTPRIGSRAPTPPGSSMRRRRGCRSSRRPASAASRPMSRSTPSSAERASGVLYALGGSSGGLSLYMDEGELVYEYNMMIIERYRGALDRADRRRRAPHRGRHDDRATRRAGRGRAARRRRGGGADHGRADGAGGLHGVGDLRRRHRPRRAGVPDLRRPPPVRLRRARSGAFRSRSGDGAPAKTRREAPVSSTQTSKTKTKGANDEH